MKALVLGLQVSRDPFPRVIAIDGIFDPPVPSWSSILGPIKELRSSTCGGGKGGATATHLQWKTSTLR